MNKWGPTHSLDKREPGHKFFFSAVRVPLYPQIKVGPRPLAAQVPPLLIQTNKMETEFCFHAGRAALFQ